MPSLIQWVLGYFLNSLWQVVALAGVATLARRLLAPADARVSYPAAIGTLIAALLLPAWNARFPAFDPAGMVQVGISGLTQSGPSLHRVFPKSLAFSGRRAVVFVSPKVAASGALLYLALVLYRTGLLARKWRGTRLLLRSATIVDISPALEAHWQSWNHALKCRHVRLMSSTQVSGPVTLGFRQPALLVASGFFSEASPDEVAAALCHELAHIARHDFAMNLLLEIISLPIAFHPATWLLKAHIDEDRELICDTRAASASSGARLYAESLLSLARSMCSAPAAGGPTNALGIFEANILETRIMRLLDRRPPGRFVQLLSASMGISLLVAGSVALSFVALQPASAQHRMDALLRAPSPGDATSPVLDQATLHPSKVKGEIAPPKLLHSVDPEYTPQARSAKLSGVCVVALTIPENGIPANVHISKSLGSGLDQNAMAAVRKYRFSPATRDGVPISTDVKIEVAFKID